MKDSHLCHPRQTLVHNSILLTVLEFTCMVRIFFVYGTDSLQTFKTQESIPVGCVPSTAVAMGVGRVCLPRGVCLSGGCLPGREVSSQGCVCIPACTGQGGRCLPQCMLGYIHPHVDRMTDTCENITLPQLRCGW